MAGQTSGRSEHLQILLSPEEFAALDEFKHKNQLPTRLSAMHELLRRTLGLGQAKRVAVLRNKTFAMTKPATKPWQRPRVPLK
jgi:hypothetical protein